MIVGYHPVAYNIFGRVEWKLDQNIGYVPEGQFLYCNKLFFYTKVYKNNMKLNMV